MKRSRAWSRGSTVVEVMMSISVLAIGASGVLALQKVTTVANRDAKNLEVANTIAASWVERLRADAVLWNHPSAQNPNSDIDTETVWLANRVQPAGTETWFRPVNATQQIYGVHDAFGKDDRSGNLTGPFCVNLRLSWLRPDQRLVRAEVRVYWTRANIQAASENNTLSMQIPTPLCGGTPAAPPDVAAATDVFHFVHVATAIAKNQAP